MFNITLPEEPKRGYKKYVFDKQTTAQSPETIALPPVEQVGHLEKKTKLTVPGQTFVVLVEDEIAQPQTSSRPATGSP